MPIPVSMLITPSCIGAAKNERRPERRVPCKRQLERRREDPDPDMSVTFGCEDEDRLAEADFERERLHGRRVEIARVCEDGELVAGGAACR